MLKVERKQQGKQPRRWMLLAALLVLLAGSVTAAVLLRKTEEPPAVSLHAREDHSGLLEDRAAEELVSVTIRRRGEEAWTLTRGGDGSLVPADGGEWTVNERQADSLRGAMTQLRYEDILTADPAAWHGREKEFGLEDPLVTVTGKFSDGKERTVRIGNDTGLEEGWHYMAAEGDDNLYAVSAGIVEEMNIEFALLRPVPKPEIYAALLDRITVEDTEGKKLAEWTLKGSVTDRDAGSSWIVSAPFTAPADEEAIRNLKKSAENLRLGVYTAPASEENLKQYGLNPPARTLTFHMAAGSTGTVGETGTYDIRDHEERTVTMTVGGRTEDALADYVRFGDEIFTVSAFTLSTFSEPNPRGTAARYPVLTPLESLESVTVEEQGRTLEYTLRTTERITENGETESVRSCTLNGEEISWDAFEAAYQRLLTVTFSGTLPDNAQWQEAYKKYTFRTLSGGTHTVSLSSWDGMHDAVTVDGSTLFYLIRGGMTELPAENR